MELESLSHGGGIPLPTSLAADAPDRRKCLICCCWRPWKQFKMCPITPWLARIARLMG